MADSLGRLKDCGPRLGDFILLLSRCLYIYIANAQGEKQLLENMDKVYGAFRKLLKRG